LDALEFVNDIVFFTFFTSMKKFIHKLFVILKFS
jgi:hypothetical protein